MKFDSDKFCKDFNESLKGSGWWFHKTSKNYIIVLERFINEEFLNSKLSDLINICDISPMLREIKDISIGKERIRITCFTSSLKDMGYEYD